MAVFETSNLRIERTGETSAQLLLDVADKSVNVFNQKVFADLEAALDYIKADLAIQVVFISSAKLSKQIAGADLNEFTKISSPEEAKALSALGQRVFGKLADLPATTIIVVQGSCLGGGLEFALACDYRLLIDHPQDIPSVLQAVQRQVGRQAQLGQPKIGTVRVLRDQQWVVRLAQETGVLARRDRAVADDVWVGDEGWQALARRGEAVDDGAVRRTQVL